MALLAPAPAATPAPGPAPAARLRHIAALDGLRGLAVAGVVAFHLGWIDGGYLGVDAFFVLSGFLITSLLLAEHEGAGTDAGSGRLRSLARFWGRRARRLLPAMLVVVAAVLVWTAVGDRAQLAAVRGDAVATLLYVANWHEIATSSSYWAIFDAPSPLQHTWSLAIEEQFYLAWPLVVLGCAVAARRAGRRLAAVLGVVAVVLAVASYLLMAALYDEGDATVAYYGTGSRLGAIAVGAALAAVCGRWLLSSQADGSGRGRWIVQAAAVVALVVLAVAWLRVPGAEPGLYRGGFAGLGLAVAVVVAAACQPASPVARLLSWRPLQVLGLISYGLYLWHWVLIAMLTEERTGLDGFALDAVQLGASLAAAAASYLLLEQPIRTRRWWPQARPATAVAVGAYGAVLALAVATVAVPASDGGLDEVVGRLQAAATTVPEAVAPTTGTSPPVSTAPTTLAPLPPARVGVFGDSTAVRTGAGLTAYGERTGNFTVVLNGARVGCGVDQAGERRFLGETFVLAEFCGDPAEVWAEALATHPIDVAVIQTGLWETVERRLPSDTVWRRAGDPVLDQQITAEVRAAARFFAERGIPTVWLRNPPPTDGARQAGTVERFNELLDEVIATEPLARVVALDRFVASLPAADQAAIRPDGIHFTEQSAELVADVWLGAEVRRAADELRRLGLGQGG